MKKNDVQQLIIPKGALGFDEGAVIEIPKRYEKTPVIVIKRRPGEEAHRRAASHFLTASQGYKPYAENMAVIRQSPDYVQGNMMAAVAPAPQYCPGLFHSAPPQMPVYQNTCPSFSPQEYYQSTVPRSNTNICPSVTYPGSFVPASYSIQQRPSACTRPIESPCPGLIQQKPSACTRPISPHPACPSYLPQNYCPPLNQPTECPAFPAIPSCTRTPSSTKNATDHCPGSFQTFMEEQRKFLLEAQKLCKKFSAMSFSSNDS